MGSTRDLLHGPVVVRGRPPRLGAACRRVRYVQGGGEEGRTVSRCLALSGQMGKIPLPEEVKTCNLLFFFFFALDYFLYSTSLCFCIEFAGPGGLEMLSWTVSEWQFFRTAKVSEVLYLPHTGWFHGVT